MHTVEVYESAKQLAQQLGYVVREENLGGVGAGACTVAGQKCLFIDVTMSVVERLDQVASALKSDPATYLAQVPSELAPWLDLGHGYRDCA